METNDQIRQQLIYYLEKNSDLSETGFKVMKSHENIGFISCNYVYYNGKIKLIYNKRDLVSLYEIIPQITSEKYLEIVNNLFDLLIKIRDIGFLQYRNIIMSLERIYIDMNSYKVNVIYLPLNVTQDIEFRELERCLIGLLRQVGCNYQNICSQQYARFYELIKSDISIEMIKREMKTGDAIREIYQQQNNQFQQNNQLDVLQSTYNLVNSKYTEFDDIFARLNQAIDNLKNSEWKSSASDEFFASYDDYWKKDIELYLGLLEQMNNELGYINTNYNELKAFPKAYYR